MSVDPHNLAASPLYPYFGSKRRIAHEIWNAFGNIDNFIDPFLGTLSILLSRPTPPQTETVNDIDHMVANFWRSIKHDPDGTAASANRPIIEQDLEAWHYWLVTEGRRKLDALMPDPSGYDSEIAGIWVWGACSWIGSGWCSGDGPWIVGKDGWELRTAGQGVNRQLPHLRDAGKAHLDNLAEHMRALSSRLRYVRVCCGDWTRVRTDSVTTTHGITGIVLDPPYSDAANRVKNLYANDSGSVAHEVREWAISNGDDPMKRIAYCGYDNEEFPDSWRVLEWSTTGGYSRFAEEEEQGKLNKHRERIWFSRHCLPPEQPTLFGP